MKRLYIFLFTFIFGFTYSQQLTLDWQNCFGSLEWNYFRGLELLPNGQLIGNVNIAGDDPAFTNNHGGGEAWVLILDSNGNIYQDRCFGGSNEDSFYDIEIFENYIYFYGYTKSTDGDAQSPQIGGLNDLWVVKTDMDLNIIWEKKYGNLGPIQPIMAKATPTGGLVFAADFGIEGGGDVSHFYGEQDIWVCSIDANSNIIWETTLGNQHYNKIGALLVKENGNVVVLGETDGVGGMIECNFHPGSLSWYRDYWITELDKNGEILWQQCYGGSHHEQGFDIIEENGGYTLLGFAYSNNGDVSGNNGWDSSDLWLLHIDSTGYLKWQNCYGGTEGEAGFKIFETQENGYVLIGISNSDDGDVTANHCWPSGSGCENDPWIVVLDSNRNILWENTIGGLQNGQMARNSAVQLGEMDFVITSGKYFEYEEYGGVTSDFDCTPYPIEDKYSAWIFRLRDCELQLEESIPAKPIGADTICTVHTAQNVYTTQIQYSNYEGIEWQIEPPNAATIIEQDTSLIVNWRPYFEGQVSIKARTTSNCGESDYSDSLLIQVNTCLATQYLQTPKLKTYPNPAQDYIIFELPIITTKSKLQITDIFGKQITELSIEPKQKQLIWDCSAVSGGVYFYQTELNGEVYRGKFIVN